MSEMFDLLKEGLSDILDHQKGKKKLKSRALDNCKSIKGKSKRKKSS
jgi:hypothetical protein